MKKLVVAVALFALAPISSVALACDGQKSDATNTSSAPPSKAKKDGAQPGKDKKDAQQTRS